MSETSISIMAFFVSVDGRAAPSKPHQSFESAVAEAERLAEQPSNRQQTVRLFAQLAEYRPVVTKTHEWINPHSQEKL